MTDCVVVEDVPAADCVVADEDEAVDVAVGAALVEVAAGVVNVVEADMVVVEPTIGAVVMIDELGVEGAGAGIAGDVVPG